MDKTQDLILGVIGGPWVGVYGYPGVEAYVESIKRSGFSGRKVMLCWEIRPEVREKLIEYGFEMVDFPTPGDPFFHARMRVCDEYLRDHHKEFRYIFWLDIKDLVLQSDPSQWMEQNLGTKEIVAATEPIPIVHEETNWLWARSILGEARAEEIKDCLVLNGGVLAGTAEAMAEVFHQTHLLCYPYGGLYPPCQISMNYVLHTMLKEKLYIPSWSKGFAACLHPCWSPWRVPCWPHMRDPHPTLDLSTVLLYPGTAPDEKHRMVLFNGDWGKSKALQICNYTEPLQGVEITSEHSGPPFCIVHGYDRDWSVKTLFEYKYMFGVKRDAIPQAELVAEMNRLMLLCPQKRSLRPGRFR